jgi:uncharacterized protein YbjT (DUF2867 family)
MRVLVIGAGGFIGSAVVERLQDAGHRVVAGGRDPAGLCARWPSLETMAVDFSGNHTPSDWAARLSGVEIVVNAAGILRERRRDRFRAIHVDGPWSLFRGAVTAGVRGIVHLSALGADAGAASGYHTSKRELDERLLSLPVAVTVLRPSLVFGVGGASTDAFLRLALFPLLLLPGGGGQPVQPVHRDDLVRVLLRGVEERRGRGVVDVVGPRCMTMAEYLSTLRTGLGLGRPVVARLPALLVAAARRLHLGSGLLDEDTLAMLERGNCADVAPVTRLLGQPPRDPATFLAGETQATAARRHAALSLALPLSRYSLCLMWIWSGVTSVLFHPRADSLGLLARTGLYGDAALVALYGGALADIGLGLALLVPPLRRAAYALQLLLMAFYTLLISASLPEFWLHPYGPVLKNLPVAALTLLMLWMEKPRGLSRR